MHSSYIGFGSTVLDRLEANSRVLSFSSIAFLRLKAAAFIFS